MKRTFTLFLTLYVNSCLWSCDLRILVLNSQLKPEWNADVEVTGGGSSLRVSTNGSGVAEVCDLPFGPFHLRLIPRVTGQFEVSVRNAEFVGDPLELTLVRPNSVLLPDPVGSAGCVFTLRVIDSVSRLPLRASVLIRQSARSTDSRGRIKVRLAKGRPEPVRFRANAYSDREIVLVCRGLEAQGMDVELQPSSH